MPETDVTEKAVLVGLYCKGRPEDSTETTLDELEALLTTAGGVAVARVLQNRDAPDPRTFIGEGKVMELKDFCRQTGAELVVFDNELSPSQTGALADLLGVRVVDRSLLILDVFADRAQTREGKLQVELARYQYILPRLRGLGLVLSRQTGQGGIGARRGPGETKLETDRRHIRQRMDKLREELRHVRQVRGVARNRRMKQEIPMVSFIGYTNAGKSTLMNQMTGAGVHTADRLFDTLDTTTRMVKLSDTQDILLTDTVGFIHKLPHHLIAAFKATLEELTFSSLLLHVIDVSNPNWRDQAQVVDALVVSLGAESIPCVRVYNKVDLCPVESAWREEDAVFLSAQSGQGVEMLWETLKKQLDQGLRRVSVLLPYDQSFVLDKLYKEAHVNTVHYEESGILVDAVCDAKVWGQVRNFQV